MTPDMIAALSSGRAMVTGFFEIGLPSGTRRLLYGSTRVGWGGNDFLGYDPTIGSVDASDQVSEDMSGEAPNTSITVQIAPGANRDEIAGQQVQLSPTKIWLTALRLDGADHLEVVPDPELLFDGFIDQATINLDKGRDDIDYTVISAFDYFFEDNEGQRLNGQFHRSIFAGEKGLDNVTGVTKKLYWGTDGSKISVSSGIGGGLGGITGGSGSSISGILTNQK